MLFLLYDLRPNQKKKQQTTNKQKKNPNKNGSLA